MNCRNSATSPTRRTSRWLKSGLFGAALALFGTAQAQNVNVTATAGTASASYLTLNAAFNAINLGTHQGAIVCTVVASTTEPATPSPLLASGGTSSYTSVLVNCTGNVTVNSAATPTASRGIIELVGADNVTIDGDDPGTGGTRNLTFQVATTTNSGTQCIRLASNSATGADGANNNTVRNCNLIGGRNSASSTTTSWGILMSNSTASTGGAYSSLNTVIDNNEITRCYTGIGAIGVSATYLNTGTIIRNNIIGSATSANNIGSRGININYSSSTAGSGSALIQNNDIRGGDYSTTGYSATVAGIETGTVNAGLTIERNNIHDVYQQNSGGYHALGIYITGAASMTGLTIRNNFIRDMVSSLYTTSVTTTGDTYGIYFSAGATGVNIDHNTIRLTINPTVGSTPNHINACVAATVSGVTITSFRNNILVNTLNSVNAYGLYCNTTTNISGGSVDNNAYYVPTGKVGYYNGAARTTLSDWQTATGKDGASINLNAPVVSATDLHIDLSNPNASAFNGTGANGTGVADDLDGDVRGTPPDIGADEFILLACDAANGGTITPANASGCTGGTYTMSSTGFSYGAGLSYQWEVSSTGGGSGFTNVSGGTGATATSYTTGALTPGVLYYRLRVTCANGPVVGYSSEVALTTYAIPSATAGSNSPICAGSALDLTGSSDIGTAFNWTGPAGYTNSTQNPQVSASSTLAMAGTYVLTASANGCSSAPSNTVVVVNPSPTGVTASANSASVCSGGTVDLTSTGVAPDSPILTEDFNGEVVGWTTTNTSTGGTPANAAWVPRPNGYTYLTAPLGGPFSSNDASQFYMTNSDAQGSGGTTATTLVSPVFSLVGYTSASARFYHMYRDIGDTGDSAVFETSTDGTTWAIAQPFTATVGTATGFVSVTVPLTGLLGQPTVQVRFRYKGTYDYYWCVDNFTVLAGGLPSFAWAGSPGSYTSSEQNPTGVPVTAPSTTYTVTATALNGCTTTAQTSVSIGSGAAPSVEASAGGPTSFCAGGSVILNSEITDGCPPFTYAWSDGVGIVSTDPTYTATISGSYTVAISDAGSQTATSEPVEVIVNPIPMITAGGNNPVCEGEALNLTGSSDVAGSTYSWTGPLSFVSTDQNPAVSASATVGMAGTYSLIVTANGCVSAAATTNVAVGTGPAILGISATPSTICSGSSSQLEVSLPPVVPYCTSVAFTTNVEAISLVQFAGIDNPTTCAAGATAGGPLQDFTAIVGNVVAGQAYPITVSGTTDGNFTTHITAFFDWDQNGTFETAEQVGFITNTACTVNATNNVTVPPSARNGNTRMRVVKDFSSTVYPADACGTYDYGQAEDYTINVTGGVGPTTISWSPSTFLSDPTIVNPVASNVTETVEYTVTVTGGNGCSRVEEVTLTVGAGAPPVPTIEAAGPVTFCPGGSVVLNSAVVGGCNPLSYAWSDGTNTVGTDPSYTATAAGTYTLTVTDNEAQSNTSDGTVVSIFTPPTLEVTPPSGVICGTGSVELTASGAATYAWSPANGLSATTGAVVTASPAGTTTYMVTGTDANGCPGGTTVTVSVGPLPVVNTVTATPSTICEGSNSQLNATATVALPFVRISEVALNGAGGTGQTVSYPAGVTSSDVVELTNTSTVPADISGWSLMDHASANATARRTFIFPSGSIISPNGVAVVDWGTGSSSTATMIFHAGLSGDIWLSGDACGVILKNAGGAVMDAVAMNLGTFAAGTGVTASDWSGAGAPSPSGAAGSVRTGANDTNTGSDWSSSTVTTMTIGTFNPGYINTASGAVASYAWTPTTYLNDASIANPLASGVMETTEYTVTVTSDLGCPATGTVTVTIGTPAPPTVTIDAASGTTFCAGGSVLLTSIAAGGCQPLTYSWSNGSTEVATTPDLNATASGAYTLTVTDASLTPAVSNTINVLVNPAPAVSVDPPSAAFCGAAANAVLTASGADSYSWSPATGLDATTGATVTSTATSTITYTVSGSNTTTGCIGTANATVTVTPNPSVPVLSATPAALCGPGTSQLAVQMGSVQPYCTNIAFTSGVEAIGLVQFADINNSSTCTPATSGGSLEDFTNIVGHVTAGNTYPITLSGNTGGNYTTHFRVFFDFDQNGTFETWFDAGSINNTVCAANATGSIVIPATALNGNTRMRVTKRYSAVLTDPCSTAAGFGQAEDYTINVSGGVSLDTYSWDHAASLSNANIPNPVASLTETTTYTVTKSNSGGCTSTASITVNVAQPVSAGTSTAAALCNVDPAAELISLLGGSPTSGGSWTDPNGDGHSGQIDPALDIAGTYTYTVTAVAPCTDASATVDVTINSASVFYADADGDGYGDPNSPTAACGQPTGYVANQLDNCPGDGLKRDPGVCGCGTADTDSDGDGIADCNDHCPLVAGTIGSPCNDGDPNTVGDVLTSDCLCAGTVVAPCTENTVALVLNTDANGGQTSWEIIPQGGGAALCNGTGYASNTSITVACCLANGCYELRVLDSFGDGMTTGGYMLLDANNKRIIDNSSNGAGFTTVSQVANAAGFCVPLGTDGMLASSCDQMNLLSSSVLQAQPNAAVSAQWLVGNQTDDGYQFWIFDPNGGYSRRILITHANTSTGGPYGATRATYLSLSSIVTLPVPQFKLLNIKVRSMVNGVYGQFGAACRMRIDPVVDCATTQLATASCGATSVPFPGGTIQADNVSGATRYQFEFTAPGFTRLIASPTRSLSMTWINLPLTCGTTYNVRVRVSFNGGASYCTYGSSCTVTTFACARPALADGNGDGLNTRSISENGFDLWPNPNRGDLVNFRIASFDAPVENVVVDVMDLYGKRVMGKNIAVSNGALNSVFELEDLANGVYLVHITAGEQTFVKRMVVQK